jgi:beta-lactamase class D
MVIHQSKSQGYGTEEARTFVQYFANLSCLFVNPKSNVLTINQISDAEQLLTPSSIFKDKFNHSIKAKL